jgi:two-component system sensor histidine kinase HydH
LHASGRHGHNAHNVTSHQSASVLAAAGQLLLAILTLARAGRSPLRVPLALLCLDVATWTAASAAFDNTGLWAASCVDHALSPLTAPLALDFVLVFAGIRRASHVTRLAAFALCGSLSLTSVAALVFPSLAPFIGSQLWAAWLLAAAIPTMGVAIATLVRHLRATSDGEERARTWFLLFVFATGTLFGATEEVGQFAPSFPGLSDVGMLVCAIGLSIAALRFELFGARMSARTVTLFGGAAVFTFYVALLAADIAGLRAVLVVLIAFALGVAAFALTRHRIVAAAVRSERTAQLATLGRFSAQMDHDVRNPLAALKGAAQLLQRDLANDVPALDRRAFADLLVAQCIRIEAIFDRFRRLSRLELVRTDVDMNALVLSVMARQAPSVPSRIVVHDELASHLPACSADADLLASVLENLSNNAIEAMPAGGALTIATRPALSRVPAVELAITDTGEGMDARTAERATDDFFTTKATGSGYGLAFARRVIEAHGGELAIRSQLGRGTQITLQLPIRSSERNTA